jgi:hypothetical protein
MLNASFPFRDRSKNVCLARIALERYAPGYCFHCCLNRLMWGFLYGFGGGVEVPSLPNDGITTARQHYRSAEACKTFRTIFYKQEVIVAAKQV